MLKEKKDFKLGNGFELERSRLQRDRERAGPCDFSMGHLHIIHVFLDAVLSRPWS